MFAGTAQLQRVAAGNGEAVGITFIEFGGRPGFAAAYRTLPWPSVPTAKKMTWSPAAYGLGTRKEKSPVGLVDVACTNVAPRTETARMSTASAIVVFVSQSVRELLGSRNS